MKQRIVLDVAKLPECGLGSLSVTWWGTLAFMLIEGTGFALAVTVYLYLFSIAPTWPTNVLPPDLLPGVLTTATLLVSAIPNIILNRWAKTGDIRKVRIGLIVMTLFGVALMVIRVFEFRGLNVSWDTNAYGSVVWLLLGLHTTHVITDLIDTVVLGVLMFTRHGDTPRRFGDVQDNALYWNFVIITWLPVYACIYGLARI